MCFFSESSVQHQYTLAPLLEETIKQCPMCYWDFPSHMTDAGKTEHVNHHFMEN
jgi:hypothetical protein